MPFGGTERFGVIRLLGAGGYGEVYEVEDRETHARCALKLLSRVDPESVLRLKSEFRAIVDLRHPNLVRIDGLHAEEHADGERWFLTLELRKNAVAFLAHVRGASNGNGAETPVFHDYVTVRPGEASRPSPPSRRAPPRFDEPRLRDALRQLADGLHYLHSHGLCHRDLKPSNVLCTEDGHVSLVDFGLSQELFAPPTAGVEGTPVYMSPEQLSGEPVGPASDWYSVGVMLYEALTGVLPFDGSDLYLALQKKSGRPRSPHELTANLPHDLAQLCIELLSPKQDDRPTGAEVQKRIVTTRRTATVARATKVPDQSHGADEAEAILELALSEVLAGEPVVIQIAGPPQSGRSTLLRRLIDAIRVHQPGAAILSSRCREQEALRFRTVDELIDALVSRLAAQNYKPPSTLLVKQLRSNFPVVGKLGDSAGTPVPSDDNPSRIAAAIAELAAPLDRELLVLTVDDLHLGDLPGIEVLGRWIRARSHAVLSVVSVLAAAPPEPWQTFTAALPGVGIRRVILN